MFVIKVTFGLFCLKWWPVSESNQGHSDFQSLALPTELTGRNNKKFFKWWPVSELNQGHSDFQSLALPTELTGHLLKSDIVAIMR